MFNVKPTAVHRATLGIASALFVWWYITHSRVGPNSVLSQHALLAIEPPYVYRLLIPKIMSMLFPIEVLNFDLVRGLVAFFCTTLTLWLTPKFLSRVINQNLQQKDYQQCQWAMLIVLTAHYALPRSLKFYYVYDLPAVVFCLVLFLLLTSSLWQLRLLALPATVIFTLNRETTIVATFIAFAWWISQKREDRHSSDHHYLTPVICATLVLLTRLTTSHLLNLPATSSVSWMDEGQIRLFANIQRMATKHHHAIALIWFGAGSLFWLPRRWHSLSQTMKYMIWACTPLFAFFCIVGNFVELRMFSELIPLFAIGLIWRPEWRSRSDAPYEGGKPERMSQAPE